MFYYDVNRGGLTTNATPGTEDKVAAMRTIANQSTAQISGLFVTGRHNTSGGVVIRAKTFPTTANTGGAAVTPGRKHPSSPAPATVISDATFTAGTGTPTVRQSIGCAAQGGFGGLIYGTPEERITLLPNGGITGNAEFYMVGGAASLAFDFQFDFAEA
jgi:hypothetical protein